MNIHFTDEAAAHIRDTYFAKSAAGAIKLAYDTEGCGCAVNGVAALWLVDSPEEDDMLARSNVFTIFYDPRHEVYFEERLLVDKRGDARDFVLKSSAQTYNPSMKVIDRRTSAANRS
jgi:uncharacterized protein YqkB